MNWATTTKTDSVDLAHMRSALTLARRGLGSVAPNPAVGCVIVGSTGQVAGRGFTGNGGRPHAETVAIGNAGERCRGATAYVSLEPCDHHGQTPPCSVALAEAGIGRAVIACNDPDPRVSGSGIRRLQDRGIKVATGVCEEQARDLNAGFFLKVLEGRPLFTLKAASTLDGRIATANGSSRWITGTGARAAGHMLRAGHDAIMIGIGTVLADDPGLDCRLSGMAEFSPVPVIADSNLRCPETARLLDRDPIILTLEGSDPEKKGRLEDRGASVIAIDADASGRPDPRAMAGALGQLGLTRVLIEGGGVLAGSFLGAGLIDRLEWFLGPKIIGGDGLPAVAGFGVGAMADAPGYSLVGTREIDGDMYQSYKRNLQATKCLPE